MGTCSERNYFENMLKEDGRRRPEQKTTNKKDASKDLQEVAGVTSFRVLQHTQKFYTQEAELIQGCQWK